MNAADFDTQFDRLTGHFHLPVDAKRETVAIDWFKAVEHYHADALERAVTELIRSAQDRYWPALGKLLTAIQSRFDKYERTSGKCGTCHGNTWIEAWPLVYDGRLYEMHSRCPDCGIPAPEMKKPNPHARPATKTEYEEWKALRFSRDTMPEWAKAKPWKSEAARLNHRAEMRAQFERLGRKLFPHMYGNDAA